jgi:hypothetical protein
VFARSCWSPSARSWPAAGTGRRSPDPGDDHRSGLGGVDRLAAEANRTERLLEDRVRALTEIDSLTDVSPRLKGLETELQNAAKRLEGLQLSNDLIAPRDGLARALRSLAEMLGDVRSDMENLDVSGALDALGNLDLSDAEAAIAEIQRLAGG